MAVNDLEENKLYQMGYNCLCSFDDSAIGCLAGNAIMGAVIFPKHIDFRSLMPGLNDSKKKTHEQRLVLYEQIKSCALTYATAEATVEEIDELNIYWAKWLAARRALAKLSIVPDFILVDGDKMIPEVTIPQLAIVKGDGKCFSIAAASILAKVERDKHIDELAKLVHEDYDWINNKSYYSEKHIAAIKKHGKTIYHRRKYVEKFLP
jgi:ribonuclease HII